MNAHTHRSSLAYCGCLLAIAALPAAAAAQGLQELEIGPIEGLTTVWHPAPDATSVPFGATVLFRAEASPTAIVTWSGAVEIGRDDTWSTALCAPASPGQELVSVTVSPPGSVGAADINQDGVVNVLDLIEVLMCYGQPANPPCDTADVDGDGTVNVLDLMGVLLGFGATATSYSDESDLLVVDIALDQITVSPISVSLDPLEIDETLPPEQLNEITMGYYFGPSIAAIRPAGEGLYRTSINRLIPLQVVADPPGFAPLVEWRVDGVAKLGTSLQQYFGDIGLHTISVGPLATEQTVGIDIYRVVITSHVDSEDTIDEGEPVVFTAVTDPPGYENDITWLSSTMYGTGDPVLGSGPTFTVQFDGTVGPWPADPALMFQWLGVKGDNTAFGQDQKLVDLEICLNPDDGTCNGVAVAGWCEYTLGLDVPLFCSPQPVLPTQICIACKVPNRCPLTLFPPGFLVRIVNDGSDPACFMTIKEQRTLLCAPCTQPKRFIVVNQP